MSSIKLNNKLPGILGPLTQFPESAKPMLELAQQLLRGAGELPTWFREYIATYVSASNNTEFCYKSHLHTSMALCGLENEEQIMLKILEVPKLRILLNLAVDTAIMASTNRSIELAKENGATDAEIHDTVLIASSFCMYNRYVKGLNTCLPEVEEAYVGMGHKLATDGYVG